MRWDDSAKMGGASEVLDPLELRWQTARRVRTVVFSRTTGLSAYTQPGSFNHSRKGYSCKSYTHSPAQSINTPHTPYRSSIPTSTGLSAAHSATPMNP